MNEQPTTSCREIGELIAWYPSGDLTDSERIRIDEHVERCSSCAEDLDFALQIKHSVSPATGEHPDPETIVQFFEDPSTLNTIDRAAVADHVAECGLCAREIRILQTVDTATAKVIEGVFTPKTAESPGQTSTHVDRKESRSWWSDLSSSTWLSPGPALGYLAATLACVALLAGQLGGPSSGTDTNRTRIDSVRFLPDQGVGMRGAGEGDIDPTTLDRSEANVLVLEFTDLTNLPSRDATYEIEILDENGALVLGHPVVGELFLDNFTLAVTLEPGALESGRYVLRVIDSGGEAIFSTLLKAY